MSIKFLISSIKSNTKLYSSSVTYEPFFCDSVKLKPLYEVYYKLLKEMGYVKWQDLIL